MSAAHQPTSVSVLDGKYALLRELGSGATGTVYEAENLIVGKKVAVKLMHAGAFAERDGQARFVAEARAAARIAHANVVDIDDLGVSRDGVPYVVMELLRGETLEEVIETRGPLAKGYAIELFLQVLAGLSAAHAQGIVHGALKLTSVLVTHPQPDRPLVKLLDFGIAHGVAAVTDDAVDFRTDVYQACALLSAMLGATELPRELVAVVKDGMALRPKDRIQSAEELAERLRPFVDAGHFVPLVAPDRQASGQPIPLIIAPVALLESGAPASQPGLAAASVIPVNMPRVARVNDSLLVSPRIPRAPSTPKLQIGEDFMPLPGDPGYRSIVEARARQTVPQRRRRSKLRRDVLPAVVATGIGFGLGVVLAWCAGLL